MKRAYYAKPIKDFLNDNENTILGILISNHEIQLEEQQRNAWKTQIKILKNSIKDFYNGFIFFEFIIPRMGKRIDNVIIINGIILIIEFKIGASEYSTNSIDQVMDYALDLKNFHEKSHYATLVPILVATEAESVKNIFESYEDKLYKPILANSKNFKDILRLIIKEIKSEDLDPIEWNNSKYKPTPTIIEAAQKLFREHTVLEITRCDAGHKNLTKTLECVNKIIEKSKNELKKSICFITGVPGSGKTLAGLNIANERHKFKEEEHTVFLSGNGPLVKVLQEALVRNQVENSKGKITKKQARREVKSFIQNIHHFRDDCLRTMEPPKEKVIIFDEAQRAWTLDQTKKFMRKKKGIHNFDKSEPEFLIEIMDKHKDWAVIICLIGGGQEINTGEAGLIEWFKALNNFPHWQIFLSENIIEYEYTRGKEISELLKDKLYFFIKDLHLNTSIRSYRSENVSHFINHLLNTNIDTAKELYMNIKEKYPILITRDLNKAKMWLKSKCRGTERMGLLASSGGIRLKPYGIFVQHKIDPVNWFLNPKDDIRSSNYLEDVATEFDIQGLELDWTCVSWDADLRFNDGKWDFKKIKGSSWQNINKKDKQLYLKNAYRVLLTRARQGMIIFIPKGDNSDKTRLCQFYDGIYNLFKIIGIKEL
ncbi:MAG: DUF2075 domain-containing protein [Promethearchaeota archaeon]